MEVNYFHKIMMHSDSGTVEGLVDKFGIKRLSEDYCIVLSTKNLNASLIISHP